MIADPLPGSPYPIGASVQPGGVNFSIYADKTTAIELLLFDRLDDPRPTRVIRLDLRRHRTYLYWHAFVPGLQAGQIYAYRVYGPNIPLRGVFHDPEKVLLDPYGRGVAMPASYDREAASRPGDNAAVSMKSVVVDNSTYDWEGDQPLHRPIPQTVIYEMHVAGFTRHPSSGVSPEKRGTYAGLVEKIPYLQDLGITAVELLQRVKIEFHGVALAAPDVGSTSHTLAVRRTSPDGRDVFYVMVNAYWEALDFALPAAPAGMQGWHLWIDTSQPSPHDIYTRGNALPVTGEIYRVGPLTIVALMT